MKWQLFFHPSSLIFHPFLTARPGLEPEFAESKSAVLPLDHQAILSNNFPSTIKGTRGLEPLLQGPHPRVLPLHHVPVITAFPDRSEGNRTLIGGAKIRHACRYTTLPLFSRLAASMGIEPTVSALTGQRLDHLSSKPNSSFSISSGR